MCDSATRIPVLAAPTASGKTAAALSLAETVPLEVVSADAMQIYRGLDIGTAKPSPEEQRRVPHHVIDVALPTEAFDVVRYVELAERAIEEVRARGRLPLVVGGTGFYLQALTEGLPATPPADRSAQAAIATELAERGLDALLEELQRAAPEDAARTQRNPRRVIRALEVLRGSGRPASQHPPRPPRFGFASAVLLPEAAVLERRVRERTRTQLAQGWLAEVRGLLAGIPSWSTAAQAIGYQELRRHLLGELTLEEAVERTVRITLRYAKRQRTWFRHRPADAVRVEGVGEERLPELRRWLIEAVGAR